MLVSKAPPRTLYSSKGTSKNASRGSAQRRQPPAGGGGKSIAAVAALSNLAGDENSEDGSQDDKDYADQKSVLQSSAAKRRAAKGGRRAGGRRSSPTFLTDSINGNGGDLDESVAIPDFPRGGINGPRPVFCVCRQGNLSDEGMLKCTDCKELFHGSCVGVSAHTIRTALPLYVCESCLKQHPCKRRSPGTVLGTGLRIAHASAASALQGSQGLDHGAAGGDDDNGEPVALLPAQNQA
ncbi:hypothetical protein FB639_005535, partial [Coemansia asiatica]